MNTLQLLTQQLSSLRNVFHDRKFREICDRAVPRPGDLCFAPAEISPNAEKRSRLKRQIWRSKTSISCVVALVCLTGTIGQRFYNKPELDVGTRAPQTIYAPESAKVEDNKTTEANRHAARIASVPILKPNEKVNQKVNKHLERILETGSHLRELLAPFPYVSTDILSEGVQHYLRICPKQEWQGLAAVLQGKPFELSQVEKVADSGEEDWFQVIQDVATVGLTQSIRAILPAPSATAQSALSELESYRSRATDEEIALLQTEIEGSRQRYQDGISALYSQERVETQPVYNRMLFALSDTEWQELQPQVQQALERMLAQGIPEGLPPELLKHAVQVQLSGLPPDSRDIAVRLLLSVLKPNLIADAEQTRLRSEQAALSVAPVYVTIEKGEPIVAAGAEITQSDFVLLDRFGFVRRTLVNWSGLIGFGGLVGLALVGYGFVERRYFPKLGQRDRLLMLMLCLSAPLLAIFRVPTTSLPAVGILVGGFYGSPLGATVVAILSILLPIGIGPTIDIGHLLGGAISGAIGGIVAGRLRCREELALLGLAVGLAQGFVYLMVNLTLSAAAGPVWGVILGYAGLHALAGLAWSIVAIGLSPYLEHLFDVVTPIRLAELSNPNRPLLKRLAREAPGTFQHTLFVATLAEAAARELKCNVELVRAGTLYHDIGKLHDPLGFVENQMGQPNKHDRINDPRLSATIIKKHVSEGLVLARRARLPKAIRAFIPEHQGTMLIAYFYHHAQQQAQQMEGTGQRVCEEDYRYDGPIPQSRETGIVMLADSCEAALRSLDEATPEQALIVVNKIMRARWQDNQLADAGLTRLDLSLMAQIFVQVWQQSNHKRIAYPKAAIAPLCKVAR
jgi:cyclic-di-AMP phosphodiesterase PgpH